MTENGDMDREMSRCIISSVTPRGSNGGRNATNAHRKDVVSAHLELLESAWDITACRLLDKGMDALTSLSPRRRCRSFPPLPDIL